MYLSRTLLSCSVAAIAAAIASPVYAGDVTGSVFDASETVVLQSAQLRIVELGRVTTSGRDGSFIFADVPEGTYTLETRYVGVGTITRKITVTQTGTLRVEIAMGGDDADVILVQGQRANLASALSRKRESDTVSDVLTRDAIGQFPDQNVAESLRRLPGINVLNDQGEGRFVSVRGMDPELNSTSLNGVRLPAPESDVRSVALDVISSDIIESIEVKKSLTPDMDGDTIGASIEIKTTSAFSRKKDLLTAKVEGSYNDFNGTVTPKASVDFATKISDSFGVSGGISYYQRKFETDNIEADDWDDDDGLIYAEEVQYRDYDVERERISATLGFDVLLSDTTELYLKGVYSQFDDSESRRRTTFKFDEAPTSGTATTALFDDSDGEIEVERDVKDRFESQKIRSLVFGGETDTGVWKAKYAASWAKASESEDGSVDPTQFENKWEDDGLSVLIDYSDARRPFYSIVSDPGDFFDPSTYELKDVEYTEFSRSQDEEFAVNFDLGREFYLDNGSFTVQAGAKARWREKTYDFDVSFWELDDYTLADVLGEQTYRITDIGPVADHTAHTDYFLANQSSFEFQPIDSQFDSNVKDYSVNEDVLAAYLLGRWDSATLRVIGGVRFERTKNEMFGNRVVLFEEDADLPGGGTADDDTVVVTNTAYSRDYEHWLPSLNLRWEPQDNLVFRLAGYRSIVRPKLSKLAPRFEIEVNDDNEVEGEFGNPNLLPNEAWNFDASLEYYLGNNGAITAAVFYKDVKNFIVDEERENGTFLGIDFDEAVVPINGASAEVFGIELGISQHLDMLPSPFDGLLIQANYTYTDAKGLVPIDGDITDLREITLPSTSKHTFNAVLGYEKGPFSMRLAGTYRDGYLDELGSEAELDRIVDDHFQIDFSAKYRITKNVKIFYEWININDAKYFAYNTYGGQVNNYQFERYNWTMKFGTKVKF